MSKLLVLLALVSAVYATGNTCKIGGIINRLVNNQSYYWPSTWDESQDSPILEKGQTCSWTVTVPQGYYARVIIDAKMNDRDSWIQSVDSAGNFVKSTLEKKEPYFFPPSKFSLTVANVAAATFAFKIQWLPFPATPSVFHSIGSQYHLINATNTLYYEGYTATGAGVSLLAFPQDRQKYASLRSTLVFEGANWNGNYMSNLFLLYRNGLQYISIKHAIVLVNLEASNKTDLLVIQAGQKTQELNYVELPTMPNSIYNATVNSDDDYRGFKSSLISATYLNQTMIGVQMNDNATVAVYHGTPGIFSQDRNYTGAELKAALPIFYPGGAVMEWVLSSGKAVFTFQA